VTLPVAFVSALFSVGFLLGATIFQLDPPLGNLLLSGKRDVSTDNMASISVPLTANLGNGLAIGSAQASSITVTDEMAASWQSATVSTFLANSVSASATVRNGNGVSLGAGSVSLSAAHLVPVAVS